MRENNIKIWGVIIKPERTIEPPEPEEGKVMVPLYNIPMMSDERWNELARQQRRAVTA